MRALSTGRAALDELRSGIDRGEAVLVPGFHAVKHASRFGADLTHVFVLADRLGAACALAMELAPDVLGVVEGADPLDESAMRTLAGEVHPSGVVGVARKPEAAGPITGPGVVLEDPRHLGNVGASIRVAAALGARSLGTTGPADPWSPAAIRGSAGLHWALDVRPGVELAELGSPVVGFDAGGTPIGDATLASEAVLVFGTERHGLSDTARERCDEIVRIPMRAGVSSLNLATAVAIALHQLPTLDL